MIICHKSESEEEWYQEEYTCGNCGCQFMFSNYRYINGKFVENKHIQPLYCPDCGTFFEGVLCDGEYVFN